MAEEIKEPVKEQTPVQPTTETPKVEEKAPETPAKTGVEGMTEAQLKELYAKSPELFKSIVPPKVEEKPVEKKAEPPAPQSAAPVVYEGTEVKIPTDVPVNKEAILRYLANAKENGLSAAQVQRQIDWNAKEARDFIAGQPKAKSPEEVAKELDTANAAKLKADFGAQYDESMEIARQAVVQFADADMVERLKTSDPTLVKHFLKLGRANGIKPTPPGGKPRNGNETDDAAKSQDQQLRGRYPNSKGMFPSENRSE